MPSSGRALIASIVPQIDPADLTNFVNTIATAMSSALGIAFASVPTPIGGGASPPPAGSGGASPPPVTGGASPPPAMPVPPAPITGDRHTAYADAQSDSIHREQNAQDIQGEVKKTQEIMNANAQAQINAHKEAMDRASKDIQAVQKIFSAGIGLATGWVKLSFETIQDIYARIKEASPLMQTVERLFNLAMTLFFMPVGNAIAETILPYTIDLVEKVIATWDILNDVYNKGGLGAMITTAISAGTKLFSQYFIDIGNKLSKEEGLVGAIGSTLVVIGEFIKDNLAGVLKAMVNTVGFVLTHLKEFIALFVATQATMASLMMTQIFTTAASGGVFGSGASAGWSTAISGTAISLGVGGHTYKGVNWALGEFAGMAEGGYVPATDGGQVRIMAEAGEGEYAVPESKAVGFAQDVLSKNGYTRESGNTYNININGITFEELRTYMRDLVSEQISESRYRGGF